MSETVENFDFRELGQAIMNAREKQRGKALCFLLPIQPSIGRDTEAID